MKTFKSIIFGSMFTAFCMTVVTGCCCFNNKCDNKKKCEKPPIIVKPVDKPCHKEVKKFNHNKRGPEKYHHNKEHRKPAPMMMQQPPPPPPKEANKYHNKVQQPVMCIEIIHVHVIVPYEEIKIQQQKPMPPNKKFEKGHNGKHKNLPPPPPPQQQRHNKI